MTHAAGLRSTLGSAPEQTRLIVAPAETRVWESNCSFVSGAFILVQGGRGGGGGWEGVTQGDIRLQHPKNCSDKDKRRWQLKDFGLVNVWTLECREESQQRAEK